MKDKFKGVIVTLILLGLAYSLPNRSDAGINAVKQSLKKNKINNAGFKKDSVPTKPGKVAPLKKEIEKSPTKNSFKPNIKFWKEKLKTLKKNQVPKQALKPEKGQQLKRISEPLVQPPQRIKDTGFPDLSHNDNADENEVKDIVKDIKNAVYSYDGETALNLIDQKYEKYSKFPKWVALIRFLLAELVGRVLVNTYDTKNLRMLEVEGYRQVIDIYSSYKDKDSVYDYVISQSLNRLEYLKIQASQYEREIVDTYKKIEESVQIIKDLQKDRTVNDGTPSEYGEFDTSYSILTAHYTSIMDNILALGDDEGAYNFKREMQNFFKSIPDQITVNYEVYPNGNSWETPIKKTMICQVKKQTTYYLTSVRNYAKSFATFGGLDFRTEASNYYKPEVINAINEIKNYSITEHDYITPEIIEGFKKDLESYDNESEASKIMFTTNEGIEILPEMIITPTEMINVRCATNITGVFYAQKISVNSNVSKKDKPLTLKSDMFYGGLFKNFTPNTEDSNDVTNLIKKHGADIKSELQHSVCVADGLRRRLQEDYEQQYNPFQKALKSFFFKYSLGKGITLKRNKEDLDAIEINEKFLNAMGFESVSVEIKQSNNSIMNFVNVKNPADWFIFEGHYRFDLGLGIEIPQLINPYPIKKYFSNDSITLNNHTSFAVYSVCTFLRIPFGRPINDIKESEGIYWRKKINYNTVVMSYLDRSSTLTTIAINKLIEYIENCGNVQYPYTDEFKINIANTWNKIHRDLYFKYVAEAYKEDNDGIFQDKVCNLYNKFVIKSASMYKTNYYYLKKYPVTIVRGVEISLLNPNLPKDISIYLK